MRARSLVGAAGALATVLAAVAVFRPDLALQTGVLGAFARAFAESDVSALSLGGVGLVTLALLVSTMSSSDDRLVAGEPGAGDQFERTIAHRPEAVVETARRTGGDFDAAVERAMAGDDVALDRVRDRLAALATERLAATETEDSSGSATRTVEQGTWTDDRTAAAFLAGDAGPAPSLWSRLRLWLDPAAERDRRVRRTLRRIEAIDDGTAADEDKPDSDMGVNDD